MLPRCADCSQKREFLPEASIFTQLKPGMSEYQLQCNPNHITLPCHISRHRQTQQDNKPHYLKHTPIILNPQTLGMDDVNNAGKDPQPCTAHALVDQN